MKGARPSVAPSKGKNTLAEIQRLQRERDERRKAAEDYKRERLEEVRVPTACRVQ